MMANVIVTIQVVPRGVTPRYYRMGYLEVARYHQPYGRECMLLHRALLLFKVTETLLGLWQIYCIKWWTRFTATHPTPLFVVTDLSDEVTAAGPLPVGVVVLVGRGLMRCCMPRGDVALASAFPPWSTGAERIASKQKMLTPTSAYRFQGYCVARKPTWVNQVLPKFCDFRSRICKLFTVCWG